MTDLMIVSREAPIARMLCLEAERLGFSAKLMALLPQICETLIIADYDAMSEEEKMRCTTPTGRHCYLLYSEREIPADAGFLRFLRPFSVEEMMNAVKRYLTPTVKGAEEARPSFEVTEAGITLNGTLLRLTRREAAIVLVLLAHRRETVTREMLCREIWGEHPPRNNSIEVYIGRLRRKTEEVSGRRVILSVHRTGYSIV